MFNLDKLSVKWRKKNCFQTKLEEKKNHCLLKKKVQEVANNYKILLFRPFAICSLAIALNQHLACKHLFIPLPKSPLKWISAQEVTSFLLLGLKILIKMKTSDVVTLTKLMKPVALPTTFHLLVVIRDHYKRFLDDVLINNQVQIKHGPD